MLTNLLRLLSIVKTNKASHGFETRPPKIFYLFLPIMITSEMTASTPNPNLLSKRYSRDGIRSLGATTLPSVVLSSVGPGALAL